MSAAAMRAYLDDEYARAVRERFGSIPWSERYAKPRPRVIRGPLVRVVEPEFVCLRRQRILCDALPIAEAAAA